MLAESALMTAILSTIGGIVWGVRQEGRINAHDQRFELEEKTSDERHADVKERLGRIEQKLDKLNGKS